MNSPEDGLLGPKHVEIGKYINKIEIVTSVGFYSICFYIFLVISIRPEDTRKNHRRHLNVIMAFILSSILLVI